MICPNIRVAALILINDFEFEIILFEALLLYNFMINVSNKSCIYLPHLDCIGREVSTPLLRLKLRKSGLLLLKVFPRYLIIKMSFSEVFKIKIFYYIM